MPGIYDDVARAERVRVRAQDADGKHIERDLEGMLAVCLQHEMDHLEGKLFVDYLSELKRQRIRKKLDKERRERCPARPRLRQVARALALITSPARPARGRDSLMTLRVVFAGTPQFSVSALQAIRAEHAVVGVLTQPDRPAGRGRTLTASPVKAFALSTGSRSRSRCGSRG